MDLRKLCSMVDHTLLKQTATWDQIKALCDEAMEFGTASVCIPPCYVKQAHDYVQGKLTICTVVGFPNGNMTTNAKEFETLEALANGAEEIDMVINIGCFARGTPTMLQTRSAASRRPAAGASSRSSSKPAC